MRKFLPKTVNNPQGFTLVELLVVVSIIAILSVIGITVYAGVQKNARDARRKGDVDSIAAALEVHMNQTVDQYCIGVAGTYCAPVANTAWFASGAIPADPSTAAQYADLPVNGATSYTVCATLENPVSQYCKSNLQ